MKKFTVLLLAIAAWTGEAKAANGWWTRWESNTAPSRGTQVLKPDAYQVYALSDALKSVLAQAGDDPTQAQLIELPAPDGSMQPFRVWQSALLAPALAAKYPGIRTFAATSVDRPSVSARIDWTEKGFHAMVYDNRGTWLIDPYSNVNDGFYLTYYRSDYTKPVNERTDCLVADADEPASGKVMLGGGLPPLEKLNGTTKKTYRLALACTGEYAVAVAGPNPTKSAVLSAMVTSINRVTGIYEKEVTVSLQLIANTDTLIYLDGTTDPFTNLSGGTMLGENQNLIDNVIGDANYDIGHVFSTGGGGIAFLGAVCNSGAKAEGVTGLPNPVGDAFDVDYVAHEMGHQFGAAHTFNANTGSCQGNASQSSAYEPGSGTTIMAYAGICGTGDNTQPHSDPYFHARSLDQITSYITTGAGASCAATVSSGNNIPTLPVLTATYEIPHLTPFELTAPDAVDADHDQLTYCWEQWNLGDFEKSFSTTRLAGPTFRSFLPDTSATRIFPTRTRMLANTFSYLGEKLPDTNRTLRFRLTVRDVYNGLGSFNTPTDQVTLNVHYTGDTIFRVTSFNAPNIAWTGGSTQTVTWNVAHTDQAPVATPNVNIYLSVDSGRTWPYLLGSNVPNNGSYVVTIPNVDAHLRARIKVKGAGNVFFDVNDYFITINKDVTAVHQPEWSDAVKIYPVPATAALNIRTTGLNKPLKARITNALGQQVWEGMVNGQTELAVANWAKGVYYLQLTDPSGAERLVKPVLVQ